MGPLRIYLDTSVLGGCGDTGFEEDSKRIILYIQRGQAIALLSELTLAELDGAPASVRAILNSIPAENVEKVELADDVYDLQAAYLEAKILGTRWADDLLHVAAATVVRADAIVSWNFRHIVRIDKIKAYNRINFEHGYGLLTILSPREVMIDEPDE